MLTNSELNEAIRTAQKAVSQVCGADEEATELHLKELRAEQLRRATAKGMSEELREIVLSANAVASWFSSPAGMPIDLRHQIGALQSALERLP